MDQYIGEIRMFAGGYAPQGWALCNGQLLPINENEALFSLIGTTYGGDGQTNFALPNLQGRAVVNQGQSSAGTVYNMGQMGGSEEVTLTVAQLPEHTHGVSASSSTEDSTTDPTGNVWSKSTANQYYNISIENPPQMSSAAISAVGGSQPHENMMPFLTISYIISIVGMYPSQN